MGSIRTTRRRGFLPARRLGGNRLISKRNAQPSAARWRWLGRHQLLKRNSLLAGLECDGGVGKARRGLGLCDVIEDFVALDHVKVHAGACRENAEHDVVGVDDGLQGTTLVFRCVDEDTNVRGDTTKFVKVDHWKSPIRKRNALLDPSYNLLTET
ncbi:hypothetical protein chiPu_0029263 [Chiloscyllium punctatum]|uniref:Uncharacterized protein n=1 Tax=Chiloscyllium punctatum TaxID=137246 RepID=A0A401TS47_CHIPU|nr:hypothetical protein [Chiloscyllium punctatum]